MTDRKIQGSWLDAFVEYMAPFKIPETYATWTGLVTLAGAVERKVWVDTPSKGILYPNLYVLLIGPPAAGKTISIREGRRLLLSLKTHKIAPANITRAAFVDELADSKRQAKPGNGELVLFNALTVMSNEFGVFLPKFEIDFLSVLTDVWDGDAFEERKRGMKDKIYIEKPAVSILAGWTPSALHKFLPEGAWEQGFMSRTVIVYSGANGPNDPFLGVVGKEDRFNDLAHDLKIISQLYGELIFEEDAAKAITEWHMLNGKDAPIHPKLYHYSQRRLAQMIKLCTLISTSHRDDKIITLEHFNQAMKILLSVETNMSDVFKAMRTGTDIDIIEDVHHHIYVEYMRKHEKPIAARGILQLLAARTPAHNVARLLNVMVTAGWLKRMNDINTGECYIPIAKKPGLH